MFINVYEYIRYDTTHAHDTHSSNTLHVVIAIHHYMAIYITIAVATDLWQ